jgi:two-component system, NtrC family, sensor kinase
VRARELPCEGSKPQISLYVADTGCGISPDHLPRIFEPFFTSKIGVGTGLGLWVSKQLVERNEGSIRVRSRVGQGTVFHLKFPQETSD